MSPNRRASDTPRVELASVQRYDPLGAYRVRPFTIAVSIAWVVWSAVQSIWGRDVPGSPALSILTVGLLLVAALLLARITDPARAPVSRGAFVAYVALLAVATVGSVAAQWGPDRNALNDFMPLVCAVGILVIAPYRPWSELVIAGSALAALCVCCWAVADARFPVGVPPTVVALLAAGPTLIATLASAAFSMTFVQLAARVQIRAQSYSIERADRDGITRTVQADRAVILARDVAPFFERLVRQGAASAEDAERARAIADGIRSVMVEDADRTWLQHAVFVAGGNADTIDDPDALARTMSADERAVVRATLRALIASASVDPAGIAVSVRRVDQEARNRSEMRIHAQIAGQESDIRGMLNPYLAVLRMTFPSLRIAVSNSNLALRFAYDQR
ncbi:hypothetical protein [Curtobacterium ammoniigenes]|uniref:hypothetical protein n=1 Tax=Curtobacterium ammoniigenes TaxID=395387 RepID=UPI0008326187|nr:hypothetical protein [Curtobacterium ammoniigenes]